jgi:peroxiredoxin
MDTPVFLHLSPIVAAWKVEKTWSPAPPIAATDDALAHRVNLETLGPLAWAPFRAEPFEKDDSDGRKWSLAAQRGKNVVVLFFLGGKCAHCMQQLQVFGKELDALQKVNTELVALSTDPLDATKLLKQNSDGIKFPMPLLADPELEVFKRYRAFDDFENQPMHGTFLIDTSGDVRYQRISAEPFLDVEFIKTEAARINGLLKRSVAPAAISTD